MPKYVSRGRTQLAQSAHCRRSTTRPSNFAECVEDLHHAVRRALAGRARPSEAQRSLLRAVLSDLAEVLVDEACADSEGGVSLQNEPTLRRLA